MPLQVCVVMCGVDIEQGVLSRGKLQGCDLAVQFNLTVLHAVLNSWLTTTAGSSDIRVHCVKTHVREYAVCQLI
jgi:hypothetical protein